ncbi:hypothetical protein QLR68_16330 [Micromonospora sp. DH15]|nr:hypothetical protein [Micromonospora sp. DH15]
MPYRDRTCRSSAPTARSSRWRRKPANPASAVRQAAYPSPSAHRVRASQYDGPLSDGSGSSTGSALGLSVPSGCAHSTTLPACGPVVVCR